MDRVLFYFTTALLISNFGCGRDQEISALNRSVQTTEIDQKIFWGSCNNLSASVKEARTCKESYGEYFRKFNLKHACLGQFQLEYCDSADLLGICKVAEPEASDSLYFYYLADWAEEEARNHCLLRSDGAAWEASQ